MSIDTARSLSHRCFAHHSMSGPRTSLFVFGTLLLSVAFTSIVCAQSTLELPPAPATDDASFGDDENGILVELPPLEEELRRHGGSYLYQPSDITDPPQHNATCHSEPILRLPECWEEPQPICSLPDDYLGTGVICWQPKLSWFGCDPYIWEPRFVLHGAYEVFGAFYEQNRQRRDGIGHQLFVDLDLQLTGTERFHVQFRPVGEENSGGSFWQLSDPQTYVDNSTGIPQRWWFEGELQSLFGPWLGDERHQLDVNFMAGRFPFRLHNGLLMNDEVTGFVISKNNIISLPLSNLNVQLLYAPDEVDAFPAAADLWAVHLSADYRHVFIEATYAHLHRDRLPGFDANYLAASATKFWGPLTIAGRTMYRIDGQATGGDGHLQVIETSLTRTPACWLEERTGIEEMVAYLNGFYASDHWTTISGGGIDRVRNAFTVNPLLNLAAGADPVERFGAAIGVQLFRRHQDESLIPELAYEQVRTDAVFGAGVRYRRKLNARQFFELRGIGSWSDNPALRREGFFSSLTTIF